MFMTSSCKPGNKVSMIWNSLTGKECKKISSMVVILPALTNLPSLVTGTHPFSSVFLGPLLFGRPLLRPPKPPLFCC
ncbi:hypothetical protein WN66_02271 [Saccharomyces cerevisiae]|uniref:Putative uncharacterized protein YGL123C-A n=2 Tax=Saccharomyces cerevisiae TaxID=4932 RepID=YG123_YEAST|nr:RecName: Full=Putative uncharacterized protein YGL123C-A [Saccharomyces cerevisiae S288C]AAL79261.1 unknown [Saccharomyces cerevisiae]KZV11106.1 hypothetical protein WN66_02271 [Saccharomyces cerevisiae]CAY79644.1 EC1118_1G1_1618p [Saccharomyces cerevisiae EC1118]